MKYDTTEDESTSFLFEGKDDYGNWVEIPWVDNRTFKIPFGYRKDPEKPNRLIPIPKELDALEQARAYTKKYSLATVAKWLKAVTGREIDYRVLWKRFKRDHENDKKAAGLRRWAERYKAAIAEAERIEWELVGSGRKRPYDEHGERRRDLKPTWQPVRQSVSEQITPDLFDDGTPSEETRSKRKSFRGPRRPRSSRKPRGNVERSEGSVQTKPRSTD